MKVFKSTVILILILIPLTMLFSCYEEDDGNGGNGANENVCTKALYSSVMYENTFYQKRNGKLVSYDVNEFEKGFQPVYDGKENDPLQNTLLFTVSPNLTEKNGGKHVLIAVVPTKSTEKESGMGAAAYKIISFNTKNGKTKVIKDDIAEEVKSLFIYSDCVIYTTEYVYGRYDIHMIGTDGNGYKKLSNTDEQSYAVQTVYNDRIYFFDMAGIYNIKHKLYSCSLEFDDIQYLFDVEENFDVSIVDGYFIYRDNSEEIKVEQDGDKIKYKIFDICRRPISDLSSSETIIEDVYLFEGMCGDKIYYVKYEPEPYIYYFGNAETGTTEEITRYNVGLNKLYEYSLAASETREVYHAEAHISRDVEAVNSDKIVLIENDRRDAGVAKLLVVDINTVEETVLPMEE